MTEKEPFDAPPPYTPSEAGSSTSVHSANQYESHQQNETPSSSAPRNHTAIDPPSYDTVREQPGFLGSSSPDQKVYPHQQNFHQMGPIGSVLDLAGNIIGTTANIALGISGAATGAAFGTVGAAHNAAYQVTRQASITAANSAKVALGAVEGFVHDRREDRQRAKALKRELKNEKKEMKKNVRESWGSCSNSRGSSFACSSRSDASFSQPGFGHVTSSCMNTADHDTANNVDKLEMKRSNSPLVLNESWSGKECHLKTSNGALTVHGSLTASESINLETSNGNIVVDGSLVSRKDIHVKSSNGVFIVHGASIVGKDIQVNISNAPFQIKSFIEAKRIEIKTKNAPVMIANVAVGSELYVKTTNSPIEVHIVSIASRSAHIEIESSNSPVSVYLPSSFSGYFNVKSNFIGSASIVAKSSEHIVLNYDTNETSKKSGSCKNFENKSDVDITIKTSNASATMYI